MLNQPQELPTPSNIQNAWLM